MCEQDEMQIPPTLRPKLTGMDTAVKAAMLRSSRQMDISQSPSSPRLLRRTRSTEGLDSPRRNNGASPIESFKGTMADRQRPLGPSLFTSALLDAPPPSPDKRTADGHNRGKSLQTRPAQGKL